jgi:hypothetical protein
MLLLILLAALVLVLLGLGVFVVKWLLIIAAIAALLFVISFFMRGARGY